MTSLPELISNHYSKRVLFMSEEKVVVHHWHNNTFLQPWLFDIDEKGLEQFERYLHHTDKKPFHIVIDLGKEQYKTDTIPHFSGSDARSLIKRKQVKLFHDADYFHVEMQGRQAKDRRDDIVLFMGVSAKWFVEPWLEKIHSQKIPIIGMYSLPLLIQSYAKKILQIKQTALLINLSSISGLRQSFFQDQHIKMSRLSKMPRYDIDIYSELFISEINKITNYLNSIRLVSFEKNLDVYVIANNELLDKIKEEENSVAFTHLNYHFIDTYELANKSNIIVTDKTPFSGHIFLDHLLKNKLKNNYAPEKYLHYYKLSLLRRGFYVSSVALLLLAIIFSVSYIVDGFLLDVESKQLAVTIKKYKQDHRKESVELTNVVDMPYKLKEAVELAKVLTHYQATPMDMMYYLSQQLTNFPEIQLDNIHWSISIDPDDQKNDQQPVNGAEILEFSYYQIATINGYIKPFNGDYREALDLLNNFVNTIKQSNMIYNAMITNLPIDVSPDASIDSNQSMHSKDAFFSVKIIMGIYADKTYETDR